MNPERWQQIERIYNRALELDTGQRAGFIEGACAGDASLRKEVERLLARQSQAGHFIESPAIEMAAQALARDQKPGIDTDLVGRTLLPASPSKGRPLPKRWQPSREMSLIGLRFRHQLL